MTKFSFNAIMFSSLLSVLTSCSNSSTGEKFVDLTREKSVDSIRILSKKEDKKKNYVFKINIDRKIKGGECTQGYLIINGEQLAYTLELPDLDNEEYISSIPKGTYDATIITDGSLGWRVALQDVPGRTDVRIHVGNYTRQIQGCILIGTHVNLDACEVTNNFKHEAMLILQEKFNKFTTDLILGQGNIEPIDIQVEITGI